MRLRRHLLNTGINFSTADNDSKNGNLNTYQSSSTTAKATFATSNETFSVSPTPSLSSLRYRRRITQKKRKYFWESYYCCKYILLVVRCRYVLNVWVQFISSLWKFERKQGLSSLLYLKYSTSSCWYIQEYFTSAKVQRFWN